MIDKNGKQIYWKINIEFLKNIYGDPEDDLVISKGSVAYVKQMNGNVLLLVFIDDFMLFEPDINPIPIKVSTKKTTRMII